jgi:hypothetical protein
MNDNAHVVVAHDEYGQPITERDLISESYSQIPPTMPLLLVPPFDFQGSDEDWETHCLIERVKQKRRDRQEKENGNV